MEFFRTIKWVLLEERLQIRSIFQLFIIQFKNILLEQEYTKCEMLLKDARDRIVSNVERFFLNNDAAQQTAHRRRLNL